MEALSAAVGAVAGIGVDPDAALLSGGLAHNGRGEEYDTVAEVVGRLGVPIHALPGNHDDRAELRRRFELPGNGLEPILYATDVGELQLIVLDSMRPRVDPGALGDECLAWLDSSYRP
jgi:Icc protein